MKKPQNKRILNIAHRGARSVAPENTMAAFAAGWEAGADWFELDVAASSDGELVVMHDDTLSRTTDAGEVFPGRKPWTVYDFDLAELRRLDAGSWFAAADPFKAIAAGNVGETELEAFRGEPIPTLREALAFSAEKGWPVNVEIKDATGRACDKWIVERTVKLIREFGLERKTLISSFNHEYLRRTRAASADIALGALVEKIPSDPVTLLRELTARSINPGLKWLDGAAVAEIRDAGFDVFVWTVNEEADMRRVVDFGASGIFTDFPARLKALLGETAGT
jgi:glycerophosphoryl diester phosphodiesterase